MKKEKLIILASLLFTALHSLAQSVWTNPITGTNPNTANPYTAGQTVDPNISVSGIGRGSGITGSNANDRYTASGWNSSSLDLNDYFTFTLIPNPGYNLNLASFVYAGQASGTGPTSFAFRSSLDNFNSDIGTPTASGTNINLSSTIFQNINAAITFRIYGWAASSGAGTFSINDFIFNGTVTSHPNLSINDVSLNEGNAGITTFTFTVSLSSSAPAGGVTFDIGTENNSAISPSDFTTRSLTAQTIPAGSSMYTFDVLVNGDLVIEPNENFLVNITNVTNAIVTDAQGQGTIINDDAVVPVNAHLSNLTISQGTLTPAFQRGVVDYTDAVPNSTSSVTVTPTAENAGSTIQVRINGGAFVPVASGTPSAPLTLNVGNNPIDVKVTASDLATTKTYTIVVNRGAAPVTTWYVDDNSNSGDVFTPVGTGNDANPGTAALPFATITKAVAMASSGDIIFVDAGSYTEQVHVTKSLRIYGANYTTSPVTTLGSRTAESIITAVSTPQPVSAAIFLAHTLGTSIEIKGFKLLNGSPLTDAHESKGGSANDISVLVEKNWIDHGFHVSAGSNTKWKNVTVSDNYFTNLDKVATSCAVQLYDASGAATVNMTVTNNKIDGTNWRGISIGNALTANISRNQINNVPDAGILIELAMGNTTVSQNVISNANTLHIADAGGITMFGSQFTGTVNITNNTVTGSWNGFAVKNGEAITNTNIHVNNNSFDATNTNRSMYHGGTNVGMMDGECNWHGFADNATVTTRVQGPIDFVFFLTSGVDSDPATIGFQPTGLCTGGPVQQPPVDPGEDVVTIFPVPVTSMMKVQYKSPEQKKVEIVIVDQSGRVMRRENTIVTKGINLMQFDVHLLVKGIYTIIVNDGVKQSHQKMIKM